MLGFRDVVEKNLRIYSGGELFFDKMDEDIKSNRRILQALFDLKEKIFPNHSVIMSGEVAERAKEFGFGVDVMVNGGLRKNEICCNSPPQSNGKFVFIDDSFFQGRTCEKVKQWLAHTGNLLEYCLVGYDGCREKLPYVISLYRYYDYYD